jgi:hypothetical protein
MRVIALVLLSGLLLGGCATDLNLNTTRVVKMTISWPAKRDLAQASSLKISGTVLGQPWFTKVANRPSNAASTSKVDAGYDSLLGGAQAEITVTGYSGADATGSTVGTHTYSGVPIPSDLAITSIEP